MKENIENRKIDIKFHKIQMDPATVSSGGWKCEASLRASTHKSTLCPMHWESEGQFESSISLWASISAQIVFVEISGCVDFASGCEDRDSIFDWAMENTENE